MSEPFKILTYDGGGAKGAGEARLTDRLESAAPFLGQVDAFAGTSTGAILAAALDFGMPPDECVGLYEEQCEKIFASRGFADEFSGSLDEYVRADYGQEGLRDVLKRTFGDTRLPDLKREILIPTFDIATFRPKYLDRSDDWSIVDSLLGSSAAPTYFPVHIVRESMTGRATSKGRVRALIDGGVFCNNPSKAAGDFAKTKLGIDGKDIRLLSVGAGRPPHSPPEELLEAGAKVLDWGIRKWIVTPPHQLLKVLLDASVPSAHFSAKAEFGDRYHRLEPVLPEEIELDDASKIPLIKAIADAHDVSGTLDWIRENFA